MSKIIVNTEWMKKYIQLHYTKRKLLDSALKYIGTETKPDLPNPLLKLYEELNQFNLAHNEELKKSRWKMSNIVKCSSEWLQKVNQLSEKEEKLLIDSISVCHKTNIKSKLPPHLLELYNMFIKENEVKNEKK